MASGRNTDPPQLSITLPVTGVRLNETSYVNYMENLKTLDLSEFCPPEWLQHCETPFKWMQGLDPTKMFKIDVDRKLTDYPEEDQEGIYSFEKFCLHLISVFYNTIIKDNDLMKESLEKLEYVLQNISNEAFHHVFKAVKAQVLFQNNSLDEEMSRSIGESLAPSDELKSVAKAGIEAIKARFYLSNYTDTSLALECMRKASELDPKEAAWMYWTGKILRKIRRNQNDYNPSEEIKWFESAVELKRDPKHLLFLAQAYHEIATNLKYESKGKDKNVGEIKTYFKKSQDLYKECKSMKIHSFAINRRLANIAMTNYEYADYDLAEEVLLFSLDNSKNPIIYHKLGRFYTKYKQDFYKAIEYFTKGAEHGSMYCFDELVRFKYILYPDYDPYKDLETYETVFKHSLSKSLIYRNFLWYYVSKRDISKALEYCFKLADHDVGQLISFHSYCFLVTKNINIYLVLKDIIMEDYQKEHKEQHNESFENMYAHFLSIIPENMIEKLNTNKESSLRQIKKEVAKRVNSWRLSTQQYFIQHGHEKTFLLNQTSCADNQKQSFDHSSKNMVSITNWRNDPKKGSQHKTNYGSSNNSNQKREEIEFTNWRTDRKGSKFFGQKK